jgi:hypothetical protein
VAAGAALLIAGCGGGDTLSKAELIKKANAICVKYSEKGKALGQPDLANPATAEAYFKKAGGLAQAQTDELNALKPPDAQKDDYKKLTDAYGTATGLLSDLADAAGKKDKTAGTKLISELTPISQKVDDAARAIGATSCASS